MSFVTQREVDVDTQSFATALRGALRQDPDVILVGEMRDAETIETALTAAETGHLVLSTLHTLDATETVTRIVSAFPAHQQRSIRYQLSGILKAVISMRLVRASRGCGRVPAVEVMVSTGLIRDYIINEEKTYLIREAIAAGASQYGMQTFDQSLFHLVSVWTYYNGRSDAQCQQSRRVQDAQCRNSLWRSSPQRSDKTGQQIPGEPGQRRFHPRVQLTRERLITRTPERQSSLISNL